MQEINLYNEVLVRLHDKGIQRLESYLWGLAEYEPCEIDRIIEEIKENRNLWQTELWHFMEIFGENICKKEEDRGFYLTNVLIKNPKTNLWYSLGINEIASVKLTKNGLKRLNEYIKEEQNLALPHQKMSIQESILSSVVKSSKQRLVLWEIINIYGVKILNHPFIQNKIFLEKELLLRDEKDYSKSLIPNAFSQIYSKEIEFFWKKRKEGLSIWALYKHILRKNNIKYISRRGYNHSSLERSNSQFLESDKTFTLERDLTSLAYVVENTEISQLELPLPIKKRILRIEHAEEE